METFLLNNGLPALFILSFLAATVIPLGSEWLLVALLLHGHEFGSVVMVATIGNFLGACTTYGIGYLGSSFVIHKILRVDDQESSKAMAIYSRYGSWSLLFSRVPNIGDPLSLVAGTLRLNPHILSVFLFIWKLIRYWLLAHVTMMGVVSG